MLLGTNLKTVPNKLWRDINHSLGDIFDLLKTAAIMRLTNLSNNVLQTLAGYFE